MVDGSGRGLSISVKLPLLIGGLLKALYDVLLLLNFRSLPPPEEREIRAPAASQPSQAPLDARPPAGESG